MTRLNVFFKKYKFYRKLVGGVWYKYVCVAQYKKQKEGSTFWVNYNKSNYFNRIVLIENYTNNKVIEEIEEECKKYIECDTLRISKPFDKMYVIIGFYHNTKNDNIVRWVNGEHIIKDYDYIDESVIANGMNEEELINSVKEYQRCSKLTWNMYL